MNAIATLEQLKTLLPGDTPNRLAGEHGFHTLDHFIDHNEPELALDAIVYIAEAHLENAVTINARFWAMAGQLADFLLGLNQSTTYTDVVADAHEAIYAHLDSNLGENPG